MEINPSKVLPKEILAKIHGKKLKQSFMERNSNNVSWKESQAKFY